MIPEFCQYCGTVLSIRHDCQDIIKKQLENISPAERFTYGGLGWTVLKHDAEGGTLAITTKIVGERAFGGDCNNWIESSLRAHLNDCIGVDGFLGKLLTNGASLGSFLGIVSDLTADNGETDYGTASDLIALLTCNLFRKFRLIIPPADNWYWTLTPIGYAANSSEVRVVIKRGVLGEAYIRSDFVGVRPLCRLKSEIFVSV